MPYKVCKWERTLWHWQGTSVWPPAHLQNPNTPGKHWEAVPDKVGRGRAELKAEKIRDPRQQQGRSGRG